MRELFFIANLIFNWVNKCHIDDKTWSRDGSTIYRHLTCWGKVGWTLPQYTRMYGGFSSYTICVDKNKEGHTIWLVSSDYFIEGEDGHLEVMKIAERCKEYIAP